MTEAAAISGQVAVYIDFGNIVMSRYDQLHGRESFRNDKTNSRNPPAVVRQRLRAATVDLDAIIDYATSFGTVAIARAYADWSSPVNASYSQALLKRSIDLVQLFPMAGTKNGADIRLAIDAIEDLHTFPRLTHLLVVAGDSDYVALAQRAKQSGRRVVGVGAGGSVGQFWRLACDEFHYYEALPGVAAAEQAPPEPDEPGGPASQDWAAVLIRALTLGHAKSENEWLSAASLKTQMQRLDPTFNEQAAGHKNFTQYLQSMTQYVEVRTGDSGTMVKLREGKATTEATEKVRTTASPFAGPDAAVVEMRRKLGLPANGVLGFDGEGLVVRAVRTLWGIVNSREPQESVPGAQVTAELTDDRIPQTDAKRATHIVTSTGLPVLVRDAEMCLSPNDELTVLDDAALLRFIRHWMADRARNSSYPDAFSVDVLCEAVHGHSSPADARSTYEDVLRWGGFEQMAAALGPQLVPAPFLWDIAEAVSRIPGDVSLATVEEFYAAMTGPLTELERSPGSVPLTAAYLALTGAGVIAAGDGELVNTKAGSEAEDVLDAIVTRWARLLTDAGLLDVTELVARETFYRLTLLDRYQSGERRWIRRLLGLDE